MNKRLASVYTDLESVLVSSEREKLCALSGDSDGLLQSFGVVTASTTHS